MIYLALLIGFVSGFYLGTWYVRRPRKVVAEDRDAGLKRYQAMKASRGC